MRVRWLWLLTVLLLLAGPASAQILDRSFGSQGRATVAFDVGVQKTDEAVDVFELDDGRYIAVGQVDVDNANSSVVGIGLARLQANGLLDQTFDMDGRRVKDAGLTAVLDAAMTDDFSPDILVAGAAGADSALVRFNVDGSDDTGLAGDGGTTWDASGAALADRATHVFSPESDGMFVAGVFDSNATATTDLDVYLARIDSNGVPTIFGRDELGGSDANNDRVAGMTELEGAFPFGDRPDAIALLADNATPDYVGTYILFAVVGGARLANLRLEAPLPLMRNCNPAYHDFHSVALIPVSDRYHMIVGDLRNNGVAKQTYTMIIDAVDVTVEALVCGPERTTVESVADAVIPEFDDKFGALHIAMTRDARIGYWRWRRVDLGNNSAFTYLPDTTNNGGEPYSVTFPSASGTPPLGTATGITIVGEGDPVVIGSRLWRFEGGEIDFDYGLFRARDDVVFDGSFEF